MLKYIGKFKVIHSALQDRKTDPEYQELFVEIEQYMLINFDNISFEDIEDLYKQMKALNDMLPEIDDVENMMFDGSSFSVPES